MYSREAWRNAQLKTKLFKYLPIICSRKFLCSTFTKFFSRVEADKVIETTINWDTKTSGGLKGFSTKSIKVNRWILNATHGASMRQCFHEMLDHRKSN